MGVLKRSLWIVVLAVFVSGHCVTAGALSDLFFIPHQVVGQKAPDFSLPTVRGQEYKLHPSITGKRAIILFWATWCPHCRKQLAQIHSLNKELNANNIAIVLVNLGESKAAVNQYLDRNKYDFDVVMDYKKSLNDLYPMEGIPALFFVDEKGIIKSQEYALPKNYLQQF